MSTTSLKEHGRAILETAKDHLVAALAEAPEEGWTAADWAAEAGLSLEGASFAAVVVHHVAPVLVGEGRAQVVGDETVARYTAAPASKEESHSAVAAATSAPQVWSGTLSGELEVPADLMKAEFPQGEADLEAEQKPTDHEGPWIP
ncbi:MAG: hypothetical protein GY898_31260 [Proteobacteria bacterium]|nr:hypothetical protein [Pseudomonadota bacterium]